MRKEEIHLIQGDITQAITIIIDLEIEANVTIQKTTIKLLNIIHHGKDNT